MNKTWDPAGVIYPATTKRKARFTVDKDHADRLEIITNNQVQWSWFKEEATQMFVFCLKTNKMAAWLYSEGRQIRIQINKLKRTWLKDFKGSAPLHPSFTLSKV